MLKLVRILDTRQDVTLGKFVLEDTVICSTFELPWNNNKPFESCVPLGKYGLRYTFSSKFRKFTYILNGVPERTGIRIHAANKPHELNGCIAPFITAKDENGFFAYNSGVALKHLEQIIRDHFISEISIVHE